MLIDQKTRALRDHGFQRLGDEELERAPLAVAILDGQHVLAQFGKAHLVKFDAIALVADKFHLGFVGEFGGDFVDFVLGAQRDQRRQVGWQRHARHDVDVDRTLLVQHVAHVVEIFGPGELERVGDRIARRAFRGQFQVADRQPPRLFAPGGLALRDRTDARHRRMNERREAKAAAAAAPSADNWRRIGIGDTAGEFDLGLSLRHHHQKRPLGIGPLPIDPRAVAGDETVANEFLRINLPPAPRRAFRHAQRQSQVADHERLIALVGQRNGPGQHAAVELERFIGFEVLISSRGAN